MSGLSGTVVLQDNGGDDLSVSGNGAFTFATRLATGAAYNVTVKTNPTGQTCSVSGGTGTVGLRERHQRRGHVHHEHLLGSVGTVSGLSGTVVLQDNGGDDLSVSSNGGFTFATQLATGAAYNVTVKTNPSRPDLQRVGRHRHGRLGERHHVAVTCTTNTYSVGGTVSGLSGTVVLQDNGGDDLSVSARLARSRSRLSWRPALPITSPSRPTRRARPAPSPAARARSRSANVTNVAVTCTTTTYSVGGTVSGLSGTVVLQDNGGDDLSVSSNGAFTFATRLAGGAAYNVTVKTNPSGQTLHGVGRHRDGRLGERHQRRGHVHRVERARPARMISTGRMVGWVLAGRR